MINEMMSGIGRPKDTGKISEVWRSGKERVEALFVPLTLIGLVTGIVMDANGASTESTIVVHLLTYFFGGFFAVRSLWNALRAFSVEVDLLMVLAAVGAAYLGAWSEGATLLFLFSLSNVLQNYAMGRTHQAIRSLLKLRPDTVSVRRRDTIETVALSKVEVGQIFVLRPGDRVPLDGVIQSGDGAFDESSVTGESIPVNKGAGDPVFAGTLNQTGGIDVRTTKPASESTLSRIIEMVEKARDRKASMESFLDRAEKVYAVAVIALVILYLALVSIIASAPFSETFYRSMVLLTVASPCALVISVPAAMLSAIAGAARGGILFKGGGFLEALRRVRTVAFDKTGTLTYGKPTLTDVLPRDGFTRKQLLQIAARAEIRSRHPIAQAIVRAATEEFGNVEEPEHFEETIGKGVLASWEEKQTIIGSTRMLEHRGIDVDEALHRQIQELYAQGRGTALVIHHDGECAGVITLMDRERPDADKQLRDLRVAGIKRIVMLTGDNSAVARAMADRLGIDEVQAELLPAEKLSRIEDLQQRHGSVAMVGDGINDAPALAQAEVGIAMGGAGTDAALESADVVLMADDLGALSRAVRLSRRTNRVIVQNVTFAMAVVVVLVTLTLTFGVPLPLGVLGHEGSTIVVVLNGLRLLRRPT